MFPTPGNNTGGDFAKRFEFYRGTSILWRHKNPIKCIYSGPYNLKNTVGATLHRCDKFKFLSPRFFPFDWLLIGDTTNWAAQVTCVCQWQFYFHLKFLILHITYNFIPYYSRDFFFLFRYQFESIELVMLI